MPRAKLLSGRGVMENHLPSVLGKKRRFYVESWGGVLTTIKHQLKTEPRSPPALVVARAMPRADRLSGRGSIGHSHPTHLKAKTRFFLSGVFTLSCDGACCRRRTTRSTVVSGCGGCVDDAWRRAKRLVTRAAREGETQVSRPSSSSTVSFYLLR